MAGGIELAKAYVTVLASTKGAGAQIVSEFANAGDRAGSSAGSRATSAFGKIFGGTIPGLITKAFAGISIGGTLGAAFTKGFNRLKAIDMAQAKLRGLGNDAQSVELIMQNASAAVKGTAFGLDAAATAAAGAVAAGIQPGERLEAVLKSVSNSAAASGSSMEEMGAIYNKVASLGKAQNDVLQQVADRGIPIYQALADQFGVTSDEVFKMASKGEISFEQFEAAMTKASGTVADEMGKTLPGAFANAQAAMGRFGANVLQGIYPQLTKFFLAFQDWMKPVEAFGKVVGTQLGGALESLVSLAGNAARAIGPAVKTGFDTAVQAATAFREAFVNAIPPWVGTAFAVTAGLIKEELTRLGGAFSGHGTSIIDAARKIGEVLGSNLPVVLHSFAGIGLNLIRVIGALATAFLPLVDSILNLSGSVGGSGLEAAFSALITILEGVSTALFQLSQLMNAHQGAVTALIATVGGIAIAYKSVATGISIGKTALDGWKTATDAVTGTVGAVKNLAEGWKLMAGGAGTAAEIAELGKSAQAGSIAFQAYDLAARAAAAGVTIFKAATSATGTAIGTLTAAIRANPFTFILAGIAAAAAALAAFFTQTEAGRQIWANLMAAIQPVLQAIGTALAAFGNDLITTLQPAIAQIGPAIESLGNAFSRLLQGIAPVVPAIMEPLSRLGEAVGTLLVNSFNAVLPVIQRVFEVLQATFANLGPVFTQFFETMSTQFMALLPMVQQLIPMFIEFGANIVTAFAPVVEQIIGQLLPAFVELGGAVMALIPQLVEAFVQIGTAVAPILPMIGQLAGVLLDLASNVLTALMPLFTQLVGVIAGIAVAIVPLVALVISTFIPMFLSIIEAILPLVQTVLGILIPAIQAILNIVTVVFQAIVPIIQGALTIVQGIIQVITGVIKGDWQMVWEGIKNILKGVWDVIKGVVEGAINIVRAIIENGINLVKSIWEAVWNGIKSIFEGIWNGIKSGVENGVNSVKNFFSQLGTDIINILTELPGKVLQIGQDIINGLVNGIKGAAGAVMDAVKNIASGLPDWVKGPLGIHSPSRVMRDQVGKWIPAGLAEGISKNANMVVDSVHDLTGAIVDAAQDGISELADVFVLDEIDGRVNLSGAHGNIKPLSASSSFSARPGVGYGQKSGITVNVKGHEDMDPDRFGKRFGEAFAHQMEGMLV